MIFHNYYFNFLNLQDLFQAPFQVLQLYLQHFQYAISAGVQFLYAFLCLLPAVESSLRIFWDRKGGFCHHKKLKIFNLCPRKIFLMAKILCQTRHIHHTVLKLESLLLTKLWSILFSSFVCSLTQLFSDLLKNSDLQGPIFSLIY